MFGGPGRSCCYTRSARMFKRQTKTSRRVRMLCALHGINLPLALKCGIRAGCLRRIAELTWAAHGAMQKGWTTNFDDSSMP